MPLAPTGEVESVKAAEALKAEGFEFDVVYTSVLKRAIKTGMNVLEGLDQMHVPMKKDWRLNERHYGMLQVRRCACAKQCEIVCARPGGSVLQWLTFRMSPQP